MTGWFDALKTKFALRDREWIALVAVEQIGRDGWPVTVREAARYADCSINVAHKALKGLEDLGLVESNPRFRGGWKITERGRWVTNA